MTTEHFTIPTKYDQAPTGSLWSYCGDADANVPPKTYIQAGLDAEMPEWMSIGDFLAIAMQDTIRDEQALRTVLAQYFEYGRTDGPRTSLQVMLGFTR